MIWRYLPLIGTVILVGVIAWRLWLQHRRYGNFGLVVFRSGSLRQKLRDGSALVMFLLLAAQAVAAVDLARWPLLIDAERELAIEALRVGGAVLMFGGLILLVAAQLALGGSWRIGIDETARPGLVTGGLYNFCRNPIYLGLVTFVIGYTLLLPTLLSVALLLGVGFVVRQQTLAEERYLLRSYGDIYRDYAQRIGRFLPMTGRLR